MKIIKKRLWEKLAQYIYSIARLRSFVLASGILSNTTPKSCKTAVEELLEHYREDDTKPEELGEVESYVLSE